MTTVLIDASNLHAGGAVQVAASFLDELATLTRERNPVATWPSGLSVEASKEVMANLSLGTVKTLNPIECDRSPTELWRWIPSGRHFDISFVVFGPEYGWPRAARRVVGFADGTSVLPRPQSLESLTGITRARAVLRGYVSRMLHSSANLLITETEVVARALQESLPRSPTIEVVPNAVNSIFSAPARWKPVPRLSARDSDYTICYVARAYAHKNHKILPNVALQLRQRHGISVDFVVTLTDDEWTQLANQDFQINVGALTVEQIPTLLAACDASILPSLLESFSVTPLEAFAMRRPLFASNCAFIRDSCGDAPIYFDPDSPSNIADVLARALTTPEYMNEHVERGAKILANHMNSRERAIRYMQILQESANEMKE